MGIESPSNCAGAAKRALSVMQPWAWLIVNGFKDVENRVWRRHIHERIYIHAGRKTDLHGWADAAALLASLHPAVPLPALEALERGGIVGSVLVTGSVQESASPWFSGPFAFTLERPERLPFTPCPGSLGFFTPEIQP